MGACWTLELFAWLFTVLYCIVLYGIVTFFWVGESGGVGRWVGG